MGLDLTKTCQLLLNFSKITGSSPTIPGRSRMSDFRQPRLCSTRMINHLLTIVNDPRVDLLGHPGQKNVAHSAGVTVLKVPQGTSISARRNMPRHATPHTRYQRYACEKVCDTLKTKSASVFPGGIRSQLMQYHDLSEGSSNPMCQRVSSLVWHVSPQRD